MGVEAFVQKHKDTFSVLGFVLGLVGLFVTIYQIGNANAVLQATNAYTIQKDARELSASLQDDQQFRDYVLNFDSAKQYHPELIADAQRSIGRLMNFYLGTFRQYKAGGIPKDIAASFGKDFCQVLQNKIIADYWQNHLAYHAELQEMKNGWCS
jgi:hypothetical protein